jgi:hypothetical protein
MNFNGTETRFLGQGWTFPLGVNKSGGISMSRGANDIESSMELILMTSKGERIMRPGFGCAIHDSVFDPNNATTHGLVVYSVKEALAMWEPRIAVDEVEVWADGVDGNRLNIVIRYTVKSTNDERNLVYPFYLIPKEE